MTWSHSFPDDISVEICTFIHSEGFPPLYTKEEAIRALSNLALVSRAWCFASRRIQYETTHASTMRHYNNLITLLANRNNYFASHIRNLTIGRFVGYGFVGHGIFESKAYNLIDVLALNSWIPGLRHLTIGNSPQPLPMTRSSALCATRTSSPPMQLTHLTVHSSFFEDVIDAKAFCSTIPALKDLTLLEISPQFVRFLAAHMPENLEALRLEEYEFWSLMTGPKLEPHYAKPTTSSLKLKTFHYRYLSNGVACLIHEALIGLSTNADVMITLAPPPWCGPEEDPRTPPFDFKEFRSRVSLVAQSVTILGMEVDE